MLARTVEVLESEAIHKLLREKGWSRLTDIQLRAIPVIKEGCNTVIVAPTGHGKTEAALLPILDEMTKLGEDAKPITVLYITPLRALINDLYERVRWWAERLGFRVARKHGDVPRSERTRRLRKVPHILITTPESLEIDLDWAYKFREYYKNVRWVIIDEAHEIVTTRRGIQLAVLLERLRRIAGDFQLILLSATIGDPALVGRAFAGSSKRPLRVVSADSGKTLELVIDAIPVEEGSKFWDEAGKRIIEHVEPLTLVFVNSKYVAEKLHESIERIGKYRVAVHHASMSAKVKEEVERKAKEGKLDIIICTKTLELGIDIGHVRKVILFRPAGTVASLIQRLGRSGHTIGGVSRGVIIAANKSDLLEALAEARLATRGIVEKPRIWGNGLVEMVARSIIGMALAQSYSVDEIYDILSSVYYFRRLDRELYERILAKLVEGNIIKITDNVVAPGPSFFRIWRFEVQQNGRRWWKKGFAEFFTTMGERDTFTVKNERGDIVGELDSEYVFKTLRFGNVIRLAGKKWVITSIDEVTQIVYVREAQEQTPVIPFWRGEGPEVSMEVIDEMYAILKGMVLGELDLPPNVYLTVEAQEKLTSIKDEIKKYATLIPEKNLIVVDLMGEETVFIVPADKKTVRTLAYALLAEASRYDTSSYVRIGMMGFSIRGPEGYDPLQDLLALDENELITRLKTVIPRTSYFAKSSKQLQLLFGVIKKLGPEDGVVFEGVVQQVLKEYFNVDAALELLKEIKNGEVKIRVNRGKALFYTLDILSEPMERLWSLNVEILIAEALKGIAFTVEELADAIGLPDKVVENKLKEMRKPESNIRVFQFIDVDVGEWRWALVEDAKTIAESEEFSSSFIPPMKDGLYMAFLKSKDGGLVHITFSPRDLIENPQDVISKAPFDEIYEVKVIPLSSYDEMSIKYYHIPRSILPYILLNAVTFMQKLQLNNPI